MPAPRVRGAVTAPPPAGAAITEVLRPYGGEVSVHRVTGAEDPDGTLRRRYGCTHGGFVLIRPDNHIAARGGPDDTALLVAFLERWITRVGDG